MSPVSFSKQLLLLLATFLALSPIANCARKKGPPPKGVTNEVRTAYTHQELTLEFLLEHQCRKPTAGECLFYTSGLSSKARKLARLMRKTPPAERLPAQKDYKFSATIWDLWPPLFFAEEDELWNPFRNIMEVAPDETYATSRMRAYFARMSTALAMTCHKHTYVLTMDMDNIPHNGIWEQYERPTLMKAPKETATEHSPGPRVDTIEMLQPEIPRTICSKIKNERPTTHKLFWQRGLLNQGGTYVGQYAAHRLGPCSPRLLSELADDLYVGIPPDAPKRTIREQLNGTVHLEPRGHGDDCFCGFQGDHHIMDDYWD